MIHYFLVDAHGNIDGQGVAQDVFNVIIPEGLTLNIGEVPKGANSFLNGEFFTAPEKEDNLAFNARSKRFSLLQESDWTQYNDVVLPNKDEWAAYRQALRDITNQDGWPTNIVWPIKP